MHSAKEALDLNELEEIRNEADSIFRELGFSSYASKSFLSICENSPLPASSLCEKTGIPDSKIYFALKELEEKGLVMRIAGTPRLYSALKPNEICETLGRMLELEHKKKENKLARLEKILKPLTKISLPSDELEIAYIARGFDNVSRRANKLLEGAEKEVVGYIWNSALYDSISNSLKELLSREVKMKLALNPDFNSGSTKKISNDRTSLPIAYPANRKILLCECNLLVIDQKKMISVTKTRADSYYAIITEDPGMIALGNSYYDNPSCCTIDKK